MLYDFKIDNDREYKNIVEDILDHEEFQKTKDINHHGLNRYDHSIRVSYCSYKLAKLLHIGYEEVARAGLLHDFFLVNNKEMSAKEKINTLVNHPKYAKAYSEKYFTLTDKEKDIITSHMFPIALTVPKYAESWIVNLVDDYITIREQLHVKKRQLFRFANFVFALILTID
ncbi:MAG: phosphohydrolase [Bacilli bacterium]|nr:phosphohydrolase [Bacilli bacterium]